MTPEPSSGAPEKFDGKTSCREFLDQLDVHFHVHSEFYQSEEAKINYLLTLLKGSRPTMGIHHCKKQGCNPPELYILCLHPLVHFWRTRKGA